MTLSLSNRQKSELRYALQYGKPIWGGCLRRNVTDENLDFYIRNDLVRQEGDLGFLVTTKGVNALGADTARCPVCGHIQ